MRKKLNLGFLNYTDKAVPSEQFGLPSIECNTNVLPDFLALYGEKSNYHKTKDNFSSLHIPISSTDRSSLAPNSTGDFALPLTIGRIYG